MKEVCSTIVAQIEPNLTYSINSELEWNNSGVVEVLL